MHYWQAMWTPDGDSLAERRVRFEADVSATVERTRTRKPGAKGVVGCVPRLRLRTEFHLDEAVDRHLSE